VNVKGFVCVLDGVGAFHLNQLHSVTLDPEVEGCLKPNIADSVLVGLAWLHGEKGFILALTIGRFSIDEYTTWSTKGTTSVQ
jgi:hypothetical protein